ncbi:MAG: ParB N-terminal domain-containing protein [Aquificota bacterium]|jgi:ParB family chromosome partitioning protein|nr:ParB N-terminal domain-containing protein [Aquificaceae bacterium]MDM7267065.1 ParB N-terminal domain-containing protein [Aquificaceae bacterium]HCO39192.1 chromosome partitioning protein ParB [Aquificaceae bacterium]
MRFREPIKGLELEFAIVPESKIVIPSIQRELSDAHIKRLMESMEKIGFVEPLTVIPTEDGYYEVINGQHRFEAGRRLGMSEFPVIILPASAKDYIIALNVEKVPSLKDKAHQAYEIFMSYLQKEPSLEEYRLEKFVEEAYLITIGFIVDKIGDKKFPGYAFEKVLKKVDFFLDSPLESAKEEREKRAEVLMKAKEVLNRRYEELGLKNALQKEAIVSKAFQMEYGRYVRNIGDDFYTVFERLMSAMEKVTFEEGELEEF